MAKDNEPATIPDAAQALLDATCPVKGLCPVCGTPGFEHEDRCEWAALREALGAPATARPSPTDDAIRDIVAAAAGISPGANPTAAGRFADALRRELHARGLVIVPAHPTGDPT